MKNKIPLAPTDGTPKARWRAGLSFFILTLVVFIVDQGSKYLVIQHLNPGETRPLLWGVLYLTHVRNPGAAFGLFAYQTTFFIVFSLVLAILMAIAAFIIPPDLVPLRLGLALSLGGVLGNLYDRLQSGLVVDFLDLRFWPVFNMADVALVIGVFLVALGLLGSSAPRHPGTGGG